MWFALESMREIPELDHTPVLRLPDGFEPLLGIAIGYPANTLDAKELNTDKIPTHYL